MYEFNYEWYFIALIIVTILTFILGLAFNYFFVYGPFSRLSKTFDTQIRQGIQFIETGLDVADDIVDTSNTVSQFLNLLCQGIEEDNGLLLEEINTRGSFMQPCMIIQGV